MKRTILVLFLMASSFLARATHIYGADFYYEFISGNNYKVSMAFYGDCAGGAFPSLSGATPKLQLKDGANVISSFDLVPQGPGVEVTPVCETEKNNTKCVNASSTIPGITRFIYSAVVIVPYASANWKFTFGGDMVSSLAGRSNSITNLNMGSAGSSVMVLEAALNNLNGPNSSPRFTTIPTPFYCVNIAQQYNPGAVDVDQDSLVYSLAPALEGGGAASYQTNYSPTYPLSVVNGSFSFNSITGQLNFTPISTQNSTVVTRVDEYRNGVVVGSATREMNFVVLANCTNNAPPTGAVDTNSVPIVGGTFVSNTTFHACEGSALIRFPIRPVDPEGDTITVSVSGLPANAVATVSNNETPNPMVVVTWPSATAAPGVYTFYLSYKDNHCPISSQQTQAYTIRIIRPNSITYRTIHPTECLHKAYVEYQLADGLLPRNVTVKQGAVTIRSFVDNTGSFTDSLAVGTYTVTMSSPLLPCTSTATLTVRDSGRFPFPPVITDAFYCKDDPPVALAATTYAGATLYWIDTQNRRFTTAPVPNTGTAGIFPWYAVQRYKVCESLPDTGLVYITKRPTADFVVSPAELCDRDTATVVFSGSIGVGPIISYEWGWAGANFVRGPVGGPYQVHWPIPGNKTITLRVLENKCPSDTTRKDYLVKPTPVADFLVKNICQYDSMPIIYTPAVLQGQQFAWDFDKADQPFSASGGPFRVHWPSGGFKRISLTVSLDGCVDTASRLAEVYGIPEAAILNVPAVHCLGDKIFLEHAGSGATFTWYPKDKVYTSPNGQPYTFTLKPTTYTLVVTNVQGCVDSDAVTYDRIEPCCNFSYPNAFTPNNDGKNDRFRVVTYGNDSNFDLSIFNRWGQRVYHSGDPKEGWDGKLNGQDCDMGTYYYQFRAKCLTGYEETKNGEFTLIR